MVQGGLGHGVVLYAEGLLVSGEEGEDACEGGESGGQLVLQHVAVLLLQSGARQLRLDEAHDGTQVRVGARHAQDDGVAVPESGGRVGVSDQPDVWMFGTQLNCSNGCVFIKLHVVKLLTIQMVIFS